MVLCFHEAIVFVNWLFLIFCARAVVFLPDHHLLIHVFLIQLLIE